MRLRIYQQKRALALLGERDEERQLGEMAHLALYFLEGFTGRREEVEKAVDRALALYPEPLPRREILRKRLLEILVRALSHPGIARFFAPGTTDLREHTLVFPDPEGLSAEVHRPDRILFTPEGPVVLEYKLRPGGPDGVAAHEKQLRTYLAVIRRLEGRPPRGYLIYLDPPEVREVELERT
ncbi:PD-(D/E)XK nuclease family protein [Thermosulfurimonas sp. F29]|uniref:PD-(D/E)XK nuclease family protein n=1 Tax=Thermosulfurimonas sp. F29 TaxID=2867247 RepID=UPI001C831354|nr:PD-(D/E)XK nuclease family protein [Thermosulfurimonas sp. F29]MBX6422102.1 PD-(D/E)XK nuclease family protein [Thermosulfurimonas sp. F29]